MCCKWRLNGYRVVEQRWQKKAFPNGVRRVDMLRAWETIATGPLPVSAFLRPPLRVKRSLVTRVHVLCPPRVQACCL